MQQKILVLVGPTASGKSALGVDLAKKFNGEIISGDSRQVYKGLDIGTGKITRREMRGVPHYLLDIASPKKIVTAHEFSRKARAAIQKIQKRNSLPIIVGGTGFYIDAVLNRTSLPEVPPNKKLRTALAKKTAAQLFAMLKKKDSKRAKSMDTPSERNNKIRLIRALEIASATTFPRFSNEESPRYDIHWIGIKLPQQTLDTKITKRLSARLRSGMIAEAKRLHTNGLSYKRMENLGLEYRSLARLLQKKITRKQFEEELLRDIKRYAKKQLMYWKRNKDIRWYDPKQKSRISSDIAAWLAMR